MNYKGRSSVTGAAIATSTYVDEQVVAATSSAWTVYELGDVQVPAGAVPSVSFGSVYGTEASGTGNGTASGWSASAAVVAMTFPIDPGLHTGFSIKLLGSAGGQAFLDATLRSASGDVAVGPTLASVQSVWLEPGASAELRFTWDVPYAVSTSGTYYVQFYRQDPSYPRFAVYQSTASSYSLGKYGIDGAALSSSADAYFTSWQKPLLAFSSSTPVLAATTSSTDAVSSCGTFRVPVDYAAIVYRETSPVQLGLYYDADTDTPYDADSDGIGPAMYDKCEIRAPLRAKPGVTNRVVVLAANSSGATEGASTLTYKTRPRFLTATG